MCTGDWDATYRRIREERTTPPNPFWNTSIIGGIINHNLLGPREIDAKDLTPEAQDDE